MSDKEQGMDLRQHDRGFAGRTHTRLARAVDLSVVRAASGRRPQRPPSHVPQPECVGGKAFVDLVCAWEHVALLVDRYGPKYLPLFMRLEEELAAHDESRSMVERARRRERKTNDHADAA